jgi:hypothetical protein
LSAAVQAADFSVAGTDFSISAFGTLGYAVSNQPYTYQRFIDDSGTFMRDSLVGMQVDARFNANVGATIQLKVAPKTTSDSGYEVTVPWAFVSFRPTNDWLIRVGKQRIPLYLYSETVDVGVTYDFARLPTEMYSIITSNDFTGLSINKTWALDRGEISVDGYWGMAETDYRYWARDDIPPIQTPGAVFWTEDITAGGVILSYRSEHDTYRLGLHRGTGTWKDDRSFVKTYPFVPLAPGIGYYQVDDSLPGPGVPTMPSITGTVVTLGAAIGLGEGFRFVGEYAQSTFEDTDVSQASRRGYVSLLKRAGNWTPYAVYAFLRSPAVERDFYRAVNYNTVPAFVPGANLINASQRLGTDMFPIWDQHSVAIGTSYAFSATSKAKAEVLRTRVGQVSALVDTPSFANIRNEDITVFSLSYSFVFQ